MIRIVLRTLAMLALAVAVFLAVLDAARSVAASELILTPLGTSWYALSPATLNGMQALIQRYIHPMIWDPGAIWLLNQPGALVMAALAALLYIVAGRRRAR